VHTGQCSHFCGGRPDRDRSGVRCV